ncbi:cysteine hydrolase family protein [Streptomyces sp. L7]
MDVQRVIVDRYPDPAYLPRLRKAIDTARADGVPVIHVTVGFRPGAPEVSARNKMFGRLAKASSCRPPPSRRDPPGRGTRTRRHPRHQAPRVSAFAGSDLDMVLRANDIDHLVLTGIATSGVVLSTLRQASDLDFTLTVLSDGCLDNDPEVHRVLTEKVFPMQADVTTVGQWVAAH